MLEKFKFYLTTAVGSAIMVYMVFWRYMYLDDLEINVSTGITFAVSVLLLFAPRAFADMISTFLKHYFSSKTKSNNDDQNNL
ncbi:MAG: hypothetical protein NXI00_10880 [Cytophagales bacterium]|nr:hypothetical protein [Cytophagales bacterium]